MEGCPKDVKIEDFGTIFYADSLKKVGSNIHVTSNREIPLNCGTIAYRTDINWLWNYSIPLSSRILSAYKDGKYVLLVTYSTWQYPEEAGFIIESLTFK